MYKKKELLYEGKAKQLFNTDNKDYVIISFKDSLTAFNNKKKEELQGKGTINNQTSNILFPILEKKGIKCHLVEVINDKEILAKKVKLIPLEVVARNIVAGSLSKRLGLETGTKLKIPIVEFYYKDDELGDPLLTYDHIKILNIASKDTIEKLKELALIINKHLVKLFASIGLNLVDIKFEFGYFHNEIILCDEISPDTSRLWESKTMKILDKDRFRKGMDDVLDAYQEVLTRLKTLKENNYKENYVQS